MNIETEKETNMKKYRLKRDGEKDIQFKGELIGEGSSQSHSGPCSNRWTEIDIYRTEGGKYVVSIIGRTCWQGETDRFQAVICDTPADVVDAMRQDGYLSRVAKEALDELSHLPEFESVSVEEID